MAEQRKKKVIKSTKPERRKAPVRRKEAGSTKTNAFTHYTDFLFQKENYIFIGAGCVLVILGMFLMNGGQMPDDDTWDPDIIYSFRRITLAPIVILIGLILPVVGLFRK